MFNDQTMKLHLQEGQIADWQISMKVGFRLEE
jgi:flavin-binding protein dodecin